VVLRRLAGLLVLLLFLQPEPAVVSAFVAVSAAATAGCGSGSEPCTSCCDCSYVCYDMGDAHRLTDENGGCLDCAAKCSEYYRTSVSCEFDASKVAASPCKPKSRGEQPLQVAECERGALGGTAVPDLCR
jgi:hypothetical protein